MKDFTYSIETLEIELNKIKGTIRRLDVMQDEMYQKHPSIDSYIQKKEELEKSIELLKDNREYIRFDKLDIIRHDRDEFTITYSDKEGNTLALAKSITLNIGDTLQIYDIDGALPIEFSSE